MKLHASGEDYLETILVLQKKLGMVRSVDVARHMEVSKPSVCHAVATLRDGGFLTMDEDHFLHLTDVGREVAERTYERHCFFTDYSSIYERWRDLYRLFLSHRFLFPLYVHRDRSERTSG